MTITITEFHESDNGICDACRRKAKEGVAITLPSLAYEYVCNQCVFTLVAAVAKAQKKPQPTVAKVS